MESPEQVVSIVLIFEAAHAVRKALFTEASGWVRPLSIALLRCGVSCAVCPLAISAPTVTRLFESATIMR